MHEAGVRGVRLSLNSAADPATAPEAIKTAAAVFARDQKTLVTAFVSRYGTAVDLDDVAIMGTFPGGHRLLVRFSPDGRRIQTITYDRG